MMAWAPPPCSPSAAGRARIQRLPAVVMAGLGVTYSPDCERPMLISNPLITRCSDQACWWCWACWAARCSSGGERPRQPGAAARQRAVPTLAGLDGHHAGLRRAVLGGALPTLPFSVAWWWAGCASTRRLVGLPRSYRRVLLGAGVLAGPAALFARRVPGPAAAAAAGRHVATRCAQREGGVRHLAFAALGWGYIAWFLAHLMLLYRYMDGGPGILLVLGLATGLSDIGAFTWASRCGRHPLAPTISPTRPGKGGGQRAGRLPGRGPAGRALPARTAAAAAGALPLVIAAAPSGAICWSCASSASSA